MNQLNKKRQINLLKLSAGVIREKKRENAGKYNMTNSILLTLFLFELHDLRLHAFNFNFSIIYANIGKNRSHDIFNFSFYYVRIDSYINLLLFLFCFNYFFLLKNNY